MFFSVFWFVFKCFRREFCARLRCVLSKAGGNPAEKRWVLTELASLRQQERNKHRLVWHAFAQQILEIVCESSAFGIVFVLSQPLQRLSELSSSLSWNRLRLRLGIVFSSSSFISLFVESSSSSSWNRLRRLPAIIPELLLSASFQLIPALVLSECPEF